MSGARSKKLKTVIILLVMLFALSLGLLIGRIVYLNYFADRGSTVVVPDNIIGKDSEDAQTKDDTGSEIVTGSDQNQNNGENATQNANPGENSAVSGSQNDLGDASAGGKTAATLSLTKLRSDDNIPFNVENMLPGDNITKYYRVKVTHSGDVTLYFNTEVKSQLKNLGDVLNIKITHLESDKILYNGPFNKMSNKGYSEKLLKSPEGETYAYYQIDVSLHTSVGNEYQAANMLADFDWYVIDDENMDSPTTGDTLSIGAVAAMVGALVALVIVLVLAFAKRKKEKEDAK